jgi:quercetin dioxygenase-like cupin family protein
MAETKYGKLIVGEPKPESEKPGEIKDGQDVRTPLAYLDGNVINGAFYVETQWFLKSTAYSPPPHTHDFDEVLAFYGSNPENPRNLYGEVELWLDDERHVLTRSCLVYIPRGLKHCPMNILRADRPIFHFSAGPAVKYER